MLVGGERAQRCERRAVTGKSSWDGFIEDFTASRRFAARTATLLGGGHTKYRGERSPLLLVGVEVGVRLRKRYGGA